MGKRYQPWHSDPALKPKHIEKPKDSDLPEQKLKAEPAHD